jgi:hypothetical protein
MKCEAQKPHPLLREEWATPVCSRRSPTDAEFYSAVTTVNVIIQACALKKKPSERVGHPRMLCECALQRCKLQESRKRC